jgi:hypothetical protein
MGKSGRAIIEALIAGETNPVKLAGLADRRVKASPEEFREALAGRVTKHHRFLLRLHLNQIDALDAAMCARLSQSYLPKSRSDFSATFTTIAFDDGSLRWLEINT